MSSGNKRTLLPTGAPNYAIDDATGDIRIRPREKLLERLPVTVPRGEAFDLLHERLAVATEFFQHHGDGGRYGVYRAMSDLITYLSDRGIPRATLRPMEAVMAAIVDADNGVANPIFEPKRTPRGGKPRKTVYQLEFEGKLTIIMECCVRHCRGLGMWPYVAPAAQMAAKMVNESGWPLKVTARELEELRERVWQEKNGSSPDRMELDQSMSSRVAREMPLEWAKLLLSHEWVNAPPKLSG